MKNKIISHLTSKFTPGEIGYLLKTKYNSRFLFGDLLNLSIKGFLKIKKLDRKINFWGRYDYLLIKGKNDFKNLKEYEKFLLEKLFKDKNEIKISKLVIKELGFFEIKSILCAINNEIASLLSIKFKDIKSQDRFLLRPYYSNKNLPFIFIFIFLSIGFFIFLFLMKNEIYPLENYLLSIFWGLLVSAFFLLILSPLLIRWRRQQIKIYQEIKNFEAFFKNIPFNFENDKTEKIFLEYLPYALIFKYENQWLDYFSDKIDYRFFSKIFNEEKINNPKELKKILKNFLKSLNLASQATYIETAF